ncbi:ATPase family -like protein [Halotydeus destructor]|nr:ATPase family -like protein [Halotydeus destructor]
MPLDFEGVADKLAQLTAGYSGAEITAICQEAGLLALEENISADKVCLEHFLKALEVVRPRTSPDKIKFYEEYAEHNKMVK